MHGIVFSMFIQKQFMASKNLNGDLTDSEKDTQKLQPEETILDLPEVKDIPGQENIKVPNFTEMADTTISSDDEEGLGIFEDDNGDDASSQRIGSATVISEDDLMIKDEDLDAELDEEEDEDNFDEDDDDLNITDDSVSEDSDVTEDEKIALERTATDMDTEDNEDLYAAELDDTDDDGDKLNENDDVSGKDLDVPGEDDDDADEEIGEEDEENNDYSVADTK